MSCWSRPVGYRRLVDRAPDSRTHPQGGPHVAGQRAEPAHALKAERAANADTTAA